jgi:hypothetical protein
VQLIILDNALKQQEAVKQVFEGGGCQQVGVPVDLLTTEFNESLVFDQMFGVRHTHTLSITE